MFTWKTFLWQLKTLLYKKARPVPRFFTHSLSPLVRTVSSERYLSEQKCNSPRFCRQGLPRVCASDDGDRNHGSPVLKARDSPVRSGHHLRCPTQPPRDPVGLPRGSSHLQMRDQRPREGGGLPLWPSSLSAPAKWRPGFQSQRTRPASEHFRVLSPAASCMSLTGAEGAGDRRSSSTHTSPKEGCCRHFTQETGPSWGWRRVFRVI